MHEDGVFDNSETMKCFVANMKIEGAWHTWPFPLSASESFAMLYAILMMYDV